MELITRQKEANRAKEHFKWYLDLPEGHFLFSEKKKKIYQELCALGDNPNPDDVDRVIGNNSWTKTACDECGEYKDNLIRFGEESDPDEGSNTAWICEDCLKRACKLMGIMVEEK